MHSCHCVMLCSIQLHNSCHHAELKLSPLIRTLHSLPIFPVPGSYCPFIHPYDWQLWISAIHGIIQYIFLCYFPCSHAWKIYLGSEFFFLVVSPLLLLIQLMYQAFRNLLSYYSILFPHRQNLKLLMWKVTCVHFVPTKWSRIANP